MKVNNQVAVPNLNTSANENEEIPGAEVEVFDERLEGAEAAIAQLLAQQSGSQVDLSPAGKLAELKSLIETEEKETKNEMDIKGKKDAASPSPSVLLQNPAQSGKERLVQAVRMQENQSARSNTLDALTGLQPWDKNWVFKREDVALNPERMAAEEAIKKNGLQGIGLDLKKLEAKLRGELGSAPAKGADADSSQQAQVAGKVGSPAEQALHSRSVSDASTPVSREEQNYAGIGLSPQLMQALSQMNDAAASEEGEEIPGSAKRLPGKAASNAKAQLKQSLSSEDFLGMRGEGRDHRVFEFSPQAQTRTPLIEEGPIGSWKPHRENREGSGPDLGMGQNLKSQLGGADLQAALAGSSASAASALREAGIGTQSLRAPVKEVSAWVTQGSMAQDRFSSEALIGIGSELRTLSSAGGGEMRIRLRPDNLGELNVRVNTKGNEVTLEIQASDDRAKRVIEESVGHLRESLAGQNLSVSRIDLSVAPAGQSSSGGFDPNQQNSQLNQQQWAGQNPNSQSGSQNSREGFDNDGVGLSRGNRAAPAARGVNSFATGRTASAGTGSSSRLDVMA